MEKISNVIEDQIPGLTENVKTVQVETNGGFMRFIFREDRNPKYFVFAIIGIFIQLYILKRNFPFPDFISDSYDYLESAAYNLNVNLWPIGYAKFLQLIHKINYSDTFLVVTQFALLELALLYFFFTVTYLFRPSRLNTKVLFIFLLFNPLFLYMSNCVLSDALFSAISLFWLGQLFWMLQKPRIRHIILSAILIGAAFTIRYTAIYYPLVMLIALLISSFPLRIKLLGTLLPFILIIPFVIFTRASTKAVTGTAEFSVFGGWQIANNAMYMYEHIDVDTNKIPTKTIELDKLVKLFYQHAPPGYFNFDDYPGTFFIKHRESPLKQYMLKRYSKENDQYSFVAWGKVSPLYNTYGVYLITHYPASFLKYYIWLNMKNYFVPFLEKFGSYNIGMNRVWPLAQYWFHYKTTKVIVGSSDTLNTLFFSYPAIFMLLNLYFICRLLWLIVTRKIMRYSPIFIKILALSSTFLIINFGFSVFATPVVLRYEAIPFALLFSFSTFLLELSDTEKKKPDKYVLHRHHYLSA